MAPPTQYPIRKLIRLDTTLYEFIRRFHHRNRYVSQTECMRDLMWIGLAARATGKDGKQLAETIRELATNGQIDLDQQAPAAEDSGTDGDNG